MRTVLAESRSPVRLYGERLLEQVGRGWNEFWYAPTPAARLVWLRRGVGLLAWLWLAAYSWDITTLYGDNGLLPMSTVHQVATSGASGTRTYLLSHLAWSSGGPYLWSTHVLGLIILALATLGAVPRWTSWLAYFVVLFYIRRAPLVTGPFEYVLSFALLYLAIASLGRVGRARAERMAGAASDAAGIWTTLGLRLLQLHVAGIYLLSGLAKLAVPLWWSGLAVGQLAAYPKPGWIDSSWLQSSPLLANGLTHGWVAWELLFSVLIWNRWARPLLIASSCIIWPLIALLTGTVGYACLMMVLNLAYCQDGLFPPSMSGTSTANPAS